MELEQIYHQVQDLLVKLIQAKSINPPGQESLVIEFVAHHLRSSGLKAEIQPLPEG